MIGTDTIKNNGHTTVTTIILSFKYIFIYQLVKWRQGRNRTGTPVKARDFKFSEFFLRVITFAYFWLLYLLKALTSDDDWLLLFTTNMHRICTDAIISH